MFQLRWLSRYSVCAVGWIAIGSRFDSLEEVRNLYLLYSVQTGSESHPPSCTVGTWVSFPAGKVAGA
jgi:hypothetical protein